MATEPRRDVAIGGAGMGGVQRSWKDQERKDEDEEHKDEDEDDKCVAG
jgi:hypothetical protein